MTKTVKVKPWGEGQGDFVLINEEDLNDTHELFDAPRRGRPRKDAAGAAETEQAVE